MFALGPGIGLAFAGVVAPGRVAVQAVGLLAPALIMILGFKLWMARGTAILVVGTARGLAAGLWRSAVRRQKVDPADVLPDRQRLEELAIRAAGACTSFRTVALMIAPFTAGLVALAAPPDRTLLAGVTFLLLSFSYGATLTGLARAGYVTLFDEA